MQFKRWAALLQQYQAANSPDNENKRNKKGDGEHEHKTNKKENGERVSGNDRA